MASDDDDDEEEFLDDDGFSEDMKALSRACMLAETSPSSLPSSPYPTETANSRGGATATTSPSDSDADNGVDDLQLVRSIQERFADLDDGEEPLSLEPLFSIPPVGAEDNYENDFETLRAIQRRFAAYDDDSQKESTENSWHISEQVGVTNVASEKETSNNLFVESSNAWEGFPNCVDKSSRNSQNFEACSKTIAQHQPCNLIEWHKTGADDTAILPVKESGFPKSAQAFVDAIKKNRSCQKLIRSKLMHIEARMEEIRKLKERVKILKDFQVGCRKRTSRALSQKKDARVQLISVPKIRANKKLNEKRSSAMYYGPAENCQVAKYREALKQLPVFLGRERWTKEEKENLAKGVKQQFQEMLFQRSLDLVSGPDGSLGDSNDLDGIVATIRDHDITPESMRSFIPMVNWDELASLYVPGRSGAECQARWLNCDDPLINQDPWSALEDKNLLHVVQQKGLSNWVDIAVSLGTSRTPFQCLARYQRSLNASILKREWTAEEDNQLRATVEAFGESNWQVVASAMEGRTGTQCSNRWKKTLNPARQKVGRWTTNEDKRLKVAVMLFGPKTWNKIAQFVPGRTQVQCRERWVNSLDPSLNWNPWTEEEDLKLNAAISEHGYCWSKVAACVPRRTDNQCWRRWKVLAPEEVPLLQAARRLQRDALISNFVDRESERPALGPNDFVPLSAITDVSGQENANHLGKQRKRSRRRGETAVTKTGMPDRPEVVAITQDEDPEISDCVVLHEEGNNLSKKRKSRSKPKPKYKVSVHDAPTKKKARKPLSRPTECHSSYCMDRSFSDGEDNGGATWFRKVSKPYPQRESEPMEENGGSDATYGEDDSELYIDDQDVTRPKKPCTQQEDVLETSTTKQVKTVVGKKSDAKSTSKKRRGKRTRKRKRESPAFSPSDDVGKVSSPSDGDFIKSQKEIVGAEEEIQNSSSPLRCSTLEVLVSKHESSNVIQPLDKMQEEEEEDYDMTLASFLKKSRRAKKKTLFSGVAMDFISQEKGGDNLSDQLYAAAEEIEDDTTLAAFCGKLKRRE